MATTVFMGRVNPALGRGAVLAFGTAVGIATGGSFAPQVIGAGSKVMRNVIASFASATGSVAIHTFGSTSGYVKVEYSIVGTPLPTGGTTVPTFNWCVLGGFGSI